MWCLQGNGMTELGHRTEVKMEIPGRQRQVESGISQW